MENFLSQFSTLPKKFVNDFFIICREEYDNSDIIINFDIVCEWLDTRKDSLKKLLIKYFEKNFDYTETKKQKNQINSTGLTTYYEIFISPNCFKELCMMSRTEKAREVRKYFIEMEKLIKVYHDTIKQEMYKQIGVLKNNQKPKVDITGGIIYVIKAQNSNETLYKIGKTGNIKNRIKNYNSGNANDIVPEFIMKVVDIDGVEKCIKDSCKRFQYRKYKEIYEVDIDVLKKIMSKCSDLLTFIIKSDDKKAKKRLRKSIKEMKERKNKYFIYIEKKEKNAQIE